MFLTARRNAARRGFTLPFHERETAAETAADNLHPPALTPDRTNGGPSLDRRCLPNGQYCRTPHLLTRAAPRATSTASGATSSTTASATAASRTATGTAAAACSAAGRAAARARRTCGPRVAAGSRSAAALVADGRRGRRHGLRARGISAVARRAAWMVRLRDGCRRQRDECKACKNNVFHTITPFGVRSLAISRAEIRSSVVKMQLPLRCCRSHRLIRLENMPICANNGETLRAVSNFIVRCRGRNTGANVARDNRNARRTRISAATSEGLPAQLLKSLKQQKEEKCASLILSWAFSQRPSVLRR